MVLELIVCQPASTIPLSKYDDIKRLSQGSYFIVKVDIDLKGTTIRCPQGVYFDFKGGHILNGVITGSIKNEFLRPEWFGAKGDGVNDDTQAIENAILSSIGTRTQLYLKGQYKITRPITLKNVYEDSKKSVLPPSLNIVGCSSSQMTGDYRNRYENIPDAAIIAYNLKDGEAALNFLGDAVVACHSNTIKNIAIFCDRNTCSELSFCMRIGNADNIYMEKVDFQGYNNVIIRCGESDKEDNAIGFIFARGLFQNCRFHTWPYLQNNSNGTAPSSILYSGKGKFGFCLINEFFLNYSEVSKSSTFDSIKFLCCLFEGSCYLRGNAYFDTCMWGMPGVYKPKKSRDDRFRFLPFVDSSVSLFATRGNIILDNCHFEDCMKGVCIYNDNKSDAYQLLMVTIKNCTIVPWFNYNYVVEGKKIEPEYFLYTGRMPGATMNYLVNMVNNQVLYSPQRTSFKKFAINNGCKWMFFTNNIGIKEAMIYDNIGTCVIKELD